MDLFFFDLRIKKICFLSISFLYLIFTNLELCFFIVIWLARNCMICRVSYHSKNTAQNSAKYNCFDLILGFGMDYEYSSKNKTF